MIIYSKHIYLIDKKICGFIRTDGSKIIDIVEVLNPLALEDIKKYISLNLEWDDADFLNYAESLVIPGFIDIHIHGWATGSFWLEKTKESLVEMKRHLPKVGVTSFLATTGADTLDEIYQQIDVANVVYESNEMDADLLGLHLEGPFINKEFKGMQNEENCINPSIELMEQFCNRQLKTDIIKLMTMAPELDGAKEVAQYCHQNGIQVSVGHSAATFDEIKKTKEYGFGGFTHTFSGMRGIHHRELGVAGAALYFDDMYCEFAKQTGLTVKHEMFDIALRIKTSDKIILTTDCCGLAKVKKPFNHYVRQFEIHPNSVGITIKHYDGRIEKVDTGDYEGVKDIELGYIDSIKNIRKHSKVDIFDIMKMASINPAKYINVYDRKGSIEVGKDADLLIIDEALNIKDVITRGRLYEK